MKTGVLAGFMLLVAVQVNAQFVCLNDEGEWYFSNEVFANGQCGEPTHVTGSATPAGLRQVVNVENAELKVRLAELEARLAGLQEAYNEFVAFQFEMSSSQVRINEEVLKAIDAIKERVR